MALNGVPKRNYNELLTKIRLQRDHNNLCDEYKRVCAENAILRDENAQLKSENASMKI